MPSADEDPAMPGGDDLDLNDLLGVDSPEEFFGGKVDHDEESTAEAIDALRDQVLGHFTVMQEICKQNLNTIPEDELPTEAKATLMSDMEIDKLMIGLAFSLASAYLEQREEENRGD